jgi:hypothetical protein
MSIFQHPHLTRGIVKTPKGAFVISRGLVEMPADVGESLGWRLVDEDDDDMLSSAELARARAAHGAGRRSSTERHSGESA